MDDASPLGPRWTPLGALDSPETQSPYLHWALSSSDTGALSETTAPDVADLLHVRSSWLAKAIKFTLQGAPQAWPQALQHVLPATSFGPIAARKRGKRSRKLKLDQGKVIMGLIDDGIAFAQERFRLPGLRTRIDYLWLQGAPHSGTDSAAPFGRELDQASLNDLLWTHRSGRNNDMVDEEGLYRSVGALDMSLGDFQSLGRRAGHGTAVLDLASGFAVDTDRRDRTFQSLPDRMGIDPRTYDLALVSLPQSVTADTSGTYVEIFVLLAMIRLLDYVEQRCLDDNTDYPVVLNLSFGLSAGPKDGTSLLDRFIDAIETFREPGRAPVRVVVPSGNHRLARSYARLEDPLTKDASPLYWSLSPDDATPSFLEIWSAPMAQRPDTLPMNISLVPPRFGDGATLFGAGVDMLYELTDGAGMQARAYVQWVDQGSKSGRLRITLAVPATQPVRADVPFVTPGDWRLIITPQGKSMVGWPLDLMIQRDDMIPGFRGGGRQSRFTDPMYTEHNTAGWVQADDPISGPRPYIRRSGTMNALATARDTVVVAGCYADTLEPVVYSGSGAVGSGIRMPDVSAPASVSRLRGGISAAGNRSGSRISVQGTSVAAPTMARELAKAARPIAERTKLSGVPLLRRSITDESVPAVLPVAEHMLETYEESSNGAFPLDKSAL